jgi:hypothetical protein
MTGKFQYAFYFIESNPSYPDIPRLFFTKQANDGKISWAIELDEVNDVLIRSEFDKEEAQLWGTLIDISEEKSSIKIKNFEGDEEEAQLSPSMIWNLATLRQDPHALARFGSRVFTMRLCHSGKYRDNPEVISAEETHIREMKTKAELRSSRKSSVFDMYGDEPTTKRKKK